MNNVKNRRWSATLLGLLLMTLLPCLQFQGCESGGDSPVRLHPENPHYFLWRGEPTIFITSGEHYGAVLNKAFDYETYLQTLESHGFNLTRTFSGAYCEQPGDFRIARNTLAPDSGQLITPWQRSETPGYIGGGDKFDLSRWNPDYFHRHRNFLTEAGDRGVVVEFVLFCPFYDDSMWERSPMNAANNINGIGAIPREEVYTLNHDRLTEVQERMVVKIVEELHEFDNLYYEICNEPYFGGVTSKWQRYISEVIAQTARQFPEQHLIAQNIANGAQKIVDPDPNVSIFNFHYAAPPTTVAENYHLNRPIGDDETGFDGSEPEPYRLEGWDFILAGGAIYDNLDYSFTVGHEDGTAENDAPGDGGPVLRSQLEILKEFIEGFRFIHMQPDSGIVGDTLPDWITVRALREEQKAYALYINGDGLTTLDLQLPDGRYSVEWVNTNTGEIEQSGSAESVQNSIRLSVPSYTTDIALRLLREA